MCKINGFSLLSTDLLKEVHLLGKTGQNVFTAAQDFSLKRPEGADAHPAHSFKAHLIRLIGNLCHGHSVNQDKVWLIKNLLAPKNLKNIIRIVE